MTGSFHPLVIGPPRSGFVLLGSVVVHLTYLFSRERPLRQRVLDTLIDTLGHHVTQVVARTFSAAGITEDLILSDSFRPLLGGPKWLLQDDSQKACVHKYIGIRGMGDFSLLIRVHRDLLAHDAIVHSHAHPERWPDEPAYAYHTRFASMRNPIGMINSSVFSINALTSTYIQRFVPPEQDNDTLRLQLALFKLTDLDFFAGLCRYYKNYFKRFMPVRDRYVIMRWEDLIQHPHDTIFTLARQIGLSMDRHHAAAIWDQIGHVNLTGPHRHNYRQQGGRVGGWKQWLTNTHLDIIRQFKLEPFMEEFGYGSIEPLDKMAYSSFQKTVDEHLRRNDTWRGHPDLDLFQFSLNKSNLDTPSFSFTTYPWRRYSRITRSSFTNEDLLMQAWNAVETAVAQLDALFEVVLDGDWSRFESAQRALLDLISLAEKTIVDHMPKACEGLWPRLNTLVMEHFDRSILVDDGLPPRLIRSFDQHNLVVFRNRFFGIPHIAGELDWQKVAMGTLVPGMIVTGSFAATRAAIETMEQASREPSFAMQSLPEVYEIIKYKQWHVGLPRKYIPIDLDRTPWYHIYNVVLAPSQLAVAQAVIHMGTV